MVEYVNGDKFWYQNGLCHRLDGPAVEYIDGKVSWWYQDEYVDCNSQEQFEKFVKEQQPSKTNSCKDQTINIDGKNFKLVPVD